jgi:hypothetical protein
VTRRRGRRLGALAGAALFGVSVAAAASLGGLSSIRLGAASAAVTSCDTDGVSTTFTTAYDTTTGKYRIATVTVTGIAVGCNGKTLAVTLSSTGGANVGAGSATVVSTSQSVTVTGSASTDSVQSVAVVISG